jgi:hypothetical protein
VISSLIGRTEETARPRRRKAAPARRFLSRALHNVLAETHRLRRSRREREHTRNSTGNIVMRRCMLRMTRTYLKITGGCRSAIKVE